MYLVGNKYYIICLNFNFQRLYVIWISDEIDKLLTNDNGKIVAFRSKSHLLEFASLAGIALENDIADYDVHKFRQWILAPDNRFDCDDFLNLWNLFDDVEASIGGRFIGNIRSEERDKLYNKLFDGSGIFISEDPNPQFTFFEINLLKDILQNGMDLLLNNLVIKE